MTTSSMNVYVYPDADIRTGHRDACVTIGPCTLMFMQGDMNRDAVPDMRRLRDVLSEQIARIEAMLAEPPTPASELATITVGIDPPSIGDDDYPF